MRLNILQLGTQGVDMKSNPLLLGNKKLHAATNLVFDEGVIRTRPGFRYFKTPATGQFQGASEFRPRQGISSGTFSELGFGLVVVADGDVWFNCTSIGSGFSCKGEVNIFQAENYLIFQCFETSTFWWTGSGPLVESPGMNETDWREVETPVMELETSVPVADIPECDISSQTGGVTVIFSVVNADTEGPVEGALVTVYRNGHRAYYGMTDVSGKWTTKAVPRDYTYTVTRNGFPPVSDVPFVVLGEGEEYQWDECVPPMLIVTGQTDVNVRLSVNVPCESITNAHSFVTVPQGSYSLSEFFENPVVHPSIAEDMRWRLVTDSCGYDRIYSEGILDEFGKLSVEDVVNNFDGFDAETLSFVSVYDYPEGLHLQIGAVGCDGEDGTLWPDRDCIDGYTNQFQE